MAWFAIYVAAGALVGVLAGAADVRPLWDRRFAALLRGPSAA